MWDFRSSVGLMLKPDIWLEFLVHVNASKESTCLKPIRLANNLTKLSILPFFNGIHSLKLNSLYNLKNQEGTFPTHHLHWSHCQDTNFPKNPWGKTIILEVETSDTIKKI